MLETEVMPYYGLPHSAMPDRIETIDMDIFNFCAMERESSSVPQQYHQDESPSLRTEDVPKYTPPLNDMPDILQDHLDALNLLQKRRENNEMQLRDVSFGREFPEEFITKAEEALLENFFLETTEQRANVSHCSPDISGRSTRQPPKECLCQQEVRKEGERKTSVSVSVPCNGQDHQINVSVSHGAAKTHTAQDVERQEGCSVQEIHGCRCGASAEVGKEISVKVEVNESKHLIDLTQRSQAVEHKHPVTCEQDVSQEEDKLKLTLDLPVSEGQHWEVSTLVRSSHKTKRTQETSISVTSGVTSPQHTSDSQKKQDLGKETKEPPQREQQLTTPETPASAESVEKKHKLGIVKKLLHHKHKVFSQVVPRYEADRRVSRLEEIFFSKDSALGQKKTRDPNTWKKKLRRVCAVYVPDDLEEPPFQYIPEVLSASANIKGGVPPLQESLMLLAEGLEAGSLVAQFEQLYRRKPGLTVTEARRQDNEKKNRYRDISPYDTTRVILTSTSSGDYINASYVNMEVQGSGIINRYIASQGPLAGTCTDFWHMVWEQQSTLIVMLTTVVEQGRVKCHRYWPRLYETVDFGILQVTCNKEEETPGFAFREFTLINTETQEERHITHMQYLAWPDHGVPDDSTEFLNFVTQVRKARVGMVEPTIVHCSAGIGRTGVLILMETAQCLIEANEPIYPLDIVKAMRDQRAMMIQTASQFRFVCEAIHRVYTEELVKPLAEYQQR